MTKHRELYPNGSILYEATVVDGKHGDKAWWIDRSQDWRTALYGRIALDMGQIPDAAVRIRQIPNRIPIAYELLDGDGNVLRGGRAPTSLATLRKEVEALRAPASADDDSVLAALDRYRRFSGLVAGAHGSIRGLERYALGFHAPPVEPSRVDHAAERLRARLPPTYRAFVSTHGLFAFGGSGALPRNANHARLLAPEELFTVHSWLTQELGVAGREIRRWGDDAEHVLMRSVAFASAWEGNFHCFRFDGVDPKTGEAVIHELRQDEPRELARPTRRPLPSDTFDRFVIDLLDDKIAQCLDELDGE